ncbi:hypothetical protein [Streptomyces platensis]|uniref:hypothetical protein n=1 Tax=Streptomyces platensis TaxID=58346 RepID=UPI00386F417C
MLSGRQIALLFQVVEDLDTECARYRRRWAERRVDGVQGELPHLEARESTALPSPR